MHELDRGCTLVLGGARSGKSSFAEGLAESSGKRFVYIATGRAWDEEMTQRIALHRQGRGASWVTVEEPLDLVAALEANCGAENVVLVDCLTLWLTNLMMAEKDVDEEIARFVALLPKLEGATLLVSNEVGLGIVPENRMARDFRDHAGRLHQAVAKVAASVYFLAAGLPLKMKG
ncbi:bifunctional adenosylcobinamide kinase/adenosylcobinamide-phosphate guanylyltransferase [Phyllobacterium sp. 0TCS1.6C]|uniref:bifunctional adenosylcobinamide kinase/adenosylcobinamide-phosphate guanylyltransferase n=1 Tax=unclassified Phyllobacterium TaxID=2638441 RepID=UPI002264AD0D|nr:MULTISPECIES: bifunctional adenosylcobinamide kinase/adenosylcobinamide-phosphate guanylyltransferase [unclassified Phyllobacterium]MCX8279473.1 bifunctional adenosylcobinamide kinase/adenosylcobinamide-phosphate guanylyltransferase [Phyllobacterium sp. 0TCS1.6C]MCX8292336.1 bifunctional adenosylcobinamide kinase/adenosylcobinamide-phosphate guanylyltransferase [Phyllobacterium sp. 0TCS1.6A]